MKQWDDFDNIIIVDYEFRAGDGNPQVPICYVFKDVKTGEITKHWIDGFEKNPLYPTDKKTLFIAYFASAEIGCHLSLGYKTPPYILDLYVEFRRLTNGLKTPCGDGLLGAGQFYGLSGDGANEKDATRDLILKNSIYTPDMKQKILTYCQHDVEYTYSLFERMKKDIDLPYALLWGRYMACIAWMEYQGVPIDIQKLDDLRICWDVIKDQLIWEIDEQYHVFGGPKGTTFKINKFQEYLKRNSIPWETTPSGLPKLDKSYMEEQAKIHPEIKPLAELRYSLSQLKLNDLRVGFDGRNRCLLSPFRTKTGRNAPSTSKFIFNNATWLRHLIKPNPGKSLAYVDYCQQEIGIAAAISQDENLINDYLSGDVYLAFGKAANAIPEDGTKESYKEIRDIFKMCMLAINYGKGVESFARDINSTIPEAAYIMNWHKRRYQKYWEWNTNFVDVGVLSGIVKTPFNWYFHTKGAKRRTLMNWTMQSVGADILRLAICMCIGNGINVIAPVHDALLIEADSDKIDEFVEKTRYYMKLAALKVINFPIDTDVKVINYPERYVDPRGGLMWEKVWKIVDNITPEQKHDLQIEQIQLELPKETKKSKKNKNGLSIRRQNQLAMKPRDITERNLAARIRRKSGLSHVEVMHLINLSRESDFDLEFLIDWDQGYEYAKKIILESTDPLNKKSIQDLHGEIK